MKLIMKNEAVLMTINPTTKHHLSAIKPFHYQINSSPLPYLIILHYHQQKASTGNYKRYENCREKFCSRATKHFKSSR